LKEAQEKLKLVEHDSGSVDMLSSLLKQGKSRQREEGNKGKIV
jgi:hypothetical protein